MSSIVAMLKLELDVDACASPLPVDVAWAGVPCGLQTLPKLRDSCSCCLMRLTSDLTLGDPHPQPRLQSPGLSQQEARGCHRRQRQVCGYRMANSSEGASGHHRSPGPAGTQWGRLGDSWSKAHRAG